MAKGQQAMSTLLTINVRNFAPQAQSFYFFQEPAKYTGAGQVYSNSLYHAYLGSYNDTGAILTFRVNLQFYAGIQQTNQMPAVGQSSGYLSASRPIELTKASGAPTNNSTMASVNPVGLAPATYTQAVQNGAFRITTPVYDLGNSYNVGSAVEVQGGIVLSNFVLANPNSNTDCQPILKFYVQTGQYTPGTVMNFTQSSVSAAVCDFTEGAAFINADLQSNGVWQTTDIG
jgi:hypothetical protein